ncbi:MAG: 16S rRNA (guanine(966)-N(2))-methyltransferase RsmD [Proteobacteria bacterium]|nr:16S rRNA (guanine(966)-N(2))-methyltransferase RsmD [Pseudomonadota bacterium]
MSLRLSSGFCQGLVLETPAAGTRPTAGRVRSAVWNSVQLRLAHAKILDVCAGSGAVGIEALSRGAAAAIFVEQDKQALTALKRNLDEVQRRATKQGVAIELQVLGQAAAKALPLCQSASIDIIWLDPPFAQSCQILAELSQDLLRLIKAEGILIVECSKDELPDMAKLMLGSGWQVMKQKSYGKIGVSFFTAREPSG